MILMLLKLDIMLICYYLVTILGEDMMKREYPEFLLVFIVLGFLLSGCSNTQPKSVQSKTVNEKKSIQVIIYDEQYDEQYKRSIGYDPKDPGFGERYRKKFGITKAEGMNLAGLYLIWLGLTKDEYYKYVDNPNYNKKYNELGSTDKHWSDGVYGCRSSGCDPLVINVYIHKNKVNEAIQEMNELNTHVSYIQSVRVVSRVGMRFSKEILSKKNINIDNTILLIVKTYPGMEPNATLALRKLNTVLFARRSGFHPAGGTVVAVQTTDFEAKGESYLKKQNQLDNVKLTKNQDTSLKSNFVNKK